MVQVLKSFILKLYYNCVTSNKIVSLQFILQLVAVWAYTCECNYSNAHDVEKNALLIHDNATILVIEIIAEYEKMVHL